MIWANTVMFEEDKLI